MPKVKPLTRQDPRGVELRGEIAKLQAMTGKSFRQLCTKAGIEYGTFMAHKVNIEDMRCGELWKFRDACEREMKNV
ncbi:MAG: hypothetical protein IKF39_01065 [Oscillospiraceae bacterium]|nr:hypothetical protein [Oscillospiraceae bacterium]